MKTYLTKVIVVLLAIFFGPSFLFAQPTPTNGSCGYDPENTYKFREVGCACTAGENLSFENMVYPRENDPSLELGQAYCSGATQNGQSGVVKHCETDDDCPGPWGLFLDEVCDSKGSCNGCNSNQDCENFITNFGANPAALDNYKKIKCRKAKYQHRDKRCLNCKRLAGTGSKTITFVTRGDLDESDAQQLVGSIIGLEPFAYLHHKRNKFTFLYAGKVPNRWAEPIKTHTVSDGMGNEITYYTKESLKSVKQFANYSCGSSDVVIFVDDVLVSNIKGASSPHGIDGLVVSRKSGHVVTHELGHMLCDLGDEYKGGILGGHINLDRYDTSQEAPVCSKFDELELNRPNCYKVVGDVAKSRGTSLMSDWGDRHNVIGCAACLQKLGGMELQDAIGYCHNRVIDNYRIFDGVLSQP